MATRSIQTIRNHTPFTLTVTAPGLRAPITVPPNTSSRAGPHPDLPLAPEIVIPDVAQPHELSSSGCVHIAAFQQGVGALPAWTALVGRSDSYQSVIFATLGKYGGMFPFTRMIEAWPVPPTARPAQVILAISGKLADGRDLHITSKHAESFNGDGSDGGGCGGGDGGGGGHGPL